MQFADIILPINISQALTYGIPLKWQDKIVPGMRVEVHIGKNKIYSGIVLQTHDYAPETYKVKPIRNIIDEHPIVNATQLDFWKWIAQYYLCSLGDVMNAALPAHLKLISESLLIWSAEFENPPLDLSDDGFLIAEALSIRKQLTIAETRQLLDGKNGSKAINELLELGIATVSDILEERYKPKLAEFVFLAPRLQEEQTLNLLFNELEKAPKQLSLLLAFFQLRKSDKPIATADLTKKANASRAQLLTLVEKEVFVLEKIAVDRLEYLSIQQQKTLSLTEDQETAFQSIKENWENQHVVLLHGVTGSGKTLIYVKLIKEALARGKQVLFLLPEIALTTQIVSRLRNYFGDELGVYHSRFSNNERVEIWEKVKKEQYKIILGARSAIWLPYKNLDLIIVDEEHDSSYKQYEPSPRFNARDAAIYLSSLHHAKVVLGSATPSIESTWNAQNKKYGYVRLSKRYLGVSMPEIELVSAKNTQAGLSSIFTITLLDEIQKTLQQGKQVILFQNKRGYAPFLICGTCGWVAHCKYCDISLTYHKLTDKLHCHYCGNRTAPIKHCPQCGALKLTTKSFGTEKVEEELQRIFPKLRIGRMDWDSMKGKNKHNQLIEDFTQGRIDILVGTQMVVKGLDFENVSLVGIISADSLLSYPDFRVNERGFQLMEQVSGRAGRVDGKGKVIIQAYNLKQPVLHWVKTHDFRSFYQTELAARQHFGYPPFLRLIKIVCRQRDEKKASSGAMLLAEELKKIPNIQMQGPSPALVPRVRNNYLQEIWLKLPQDIQIIKGVKEQITIAINNTLSNRGYSTLQVIVDVDPA